MEQSEFIAPMKASLSSVEFLAQVDNDRTWAAVEKLDGYREILYLGATENHMLSSQGTDHISKCPQFQRVIPELAGTVLDCEGLSPTRMLEDNAACFKADPINAIAWQKQYGWASLVTFDCLRYKTEDRWQQTFSERRIPLLSAIEKLSNIMPIRCEELLYVGKLDYYTQIVARTQAEGHEGVILKDLRASYTPGKRGAAWLKVKRQEVLVCIITGFITGGGKFSGQIGSLAFEADGGIKGYTSGMDDTTRIDMTVNFEAKYKGRKCYIQCQEVTRMGALRHPRYLGMVEK